MLARCGRAAHICRANKNCMRNCNENLRENRKNRNCLQNQKVVIRVKVSGAIAIPKASWGCAPALPNHIQSVFLRARFSVSHFRCNCFPGTVTKCLFAAKVSQGGAVLFAPPRKAVAFLTTPSVCQKHGTGISLPAGSDQGYSP